MSWFDTSGIASIAKSALKEAQRTIDKALDIKDDVGDTTTVPANTPIDTNSDDFFGNWGISNTGTPNKEASEEVITKSSYKSIKGSTSIWGSFTGSFFDPYEKSLVQKDSKDSVDSLDDSADLGIEHFSGSKLVVQTSEDPDVLSFVATPENNEDENLESAASSDSTPAVKHREMEPGNIDNRVSIVSTDSDRKSSESVEVVNGGTGCTTSPESEALSISTSSALGSKQTSDSVEVLPNSLTSPSSVEVLGTDSISSRRQSQYTDEFVSPLQTPDDVGSGEKMTPDSVEVIPDDADENSMADDTISYNSVSESTATTVFEGLNLNLKPKSIALVKSEKMAESFSSDISLSPDKTLNLIEIPITRAPSRGGMHLPLNLIDTQPQSVKQDLTNLNKTSNIIDIPSESNETVRNEIDEGAQSDKTIVSSDSVMESSSDTSTTTDSNTNSIYLKNMLADAMTEKRDSEPKANHFMDLTQSMIDSSQAAEALENISIVQLDMPPRETSPFSSESRSDLVKIGSDHTSGHTSGDEFETTTSSDIEIISSPNGDSSSTHSRHSPAKLPVVVKSKGDTNIDSLLGKMTFKKIKGHNRELSEASSISDDTEIERLVKRLSEMTEILESRESKLIEITRKNSEIQEANSHLRKQLDEIVNKQLESADLSQVTEEYTQRLSALERKFQQAIREKDNLRKQLDQCKLDSSTRMSKSEMDIVLEEKIQTIRELREEGEKLSKQQLQHSNIIKKLRAKEKDNETAIKHLKESVEDLSSETDRLKRSLQAKEEVERSQIEAVHQLTAKNKKIDFEFNQLKDNYDDLQQKHETVKKSLDAAKKELLDKNRASSELLHREHMLQSLENEKRMTESQNEEIINQLEDLRSKMRDAEQVYLKKEQGLRAENMDLLRRLDEAESRNEELTQSVLEVSKPLVRQLETLQATHNMKLASFEKIEQGFVIKINELQNKLHGSNESEKSIKDECVMLKSKLTALDNQITTYMHENEMIKMQLEQQKTDKMVQEQDANREVDNLKQKIKSEQEIIDKLQQEIELLQQTLISERSANESERKRNMVLQEQIRDRNDSLANFTRTSPNPGTVSPALSIGRVSLSESLNSSLWPSDEPFEVSSVSRCTNMLEMQMFQTSLKQRDGEVQQLQWELNRREHERTLLNAEISNLLTRVEEFEIQCKDYDVVKNELEELQQQYETMCQLYGEKVEESEELKLDLVDVKDMYKAQIDELLKQQRNSKS